ncbi:MAG: DNA cytosine methyltransferase [Opitutales bacterium]|nr:DNA cytosine methyltransferase [Opitutales bacterium]
MNELHLFAGAGGGILGGQLLGHTCVCAVEIEPYCREVLLQRQRDGMLPKFPIWDDVKTFDGRDWRGKIDVICGGFPCQDISCAGKGAGLAGARSGLWSEFARIIGEVRPRYAFVENSPMLTRRGLGRVLGDLAEMGYDAEWAVLSAADVGAPHLRKRIWILAHARMFQGRDNQQGGSEPNCKWELEETERGCNATPSARPSERAATIPDTELLRAGRREQLAQGEQEKGHSPDVLFNADLQNKQEVKKVSKFKSQYGRSRRSRIEEDVPNAEVPRQQSCIDGQGQVQSWRGCTWWRTDPADARGAFESQLGRVAHGVANRVDRLKAIGNGQVPLVAATAFQLLKERLNNER